ncbi:uncharacterized protein MONOS_8604 [Monocercomonoides exilis]|uniref:uncharacterized protein n=1 Tax=Monocercomonoides exilis TaxID=2049356 RepID=UPI00355AAD1A|nr:hypothetical protein MONOS_8604 [Monocercomonoides exilis]|eukprot:MONOS_8604.1-p1 / transcript=MONOS_8604.1 / gene=MONOS_8604 / organism=Monocercomonoides_exilis_PA203 / gene_product=unspecified product / transcript_product=unspecified product / location=Mono_scaffold00328:32981-37017(-) / protein_length=1238 / sequence_SO=supercontig / SO=protein_coding / is_pseudo=false
MTSPDRYRSRKAALLYSEEDFNATPSRVSKETVLKQVDEEFRQSHPFTPQIDEVSKRLATKHPRKQQAKPKQWRLEEDEKDLECTYKPKITPYNFKDDYVSTPVVERLFVDAVAKKESEQQLLKQKIAEEEEKEVEGCTFHPVINEQSLQIVAAATSRAENGEMGEDSDDFGMTERAPLFERAAMLEREKKEKLNKMRIEAEMNNENLTYAPKISSQTKKIILKSSRMGPGFIQEDVVKRMAKEDQEAAQEKERIRQMEKRKEKETKYTFTPRINPLSSKLVQRSSSFMGSHADFLRRQEAKEEEKKLKLSVATQRALGGQCTFKPQTHSAEYLKQRERELAREKERRKRIEELEKSQKMSMIEGLVEESEEDEESNEQDKQKDDQSSEEDSTSSDDSESSKSSGERGNEQTSSSQKRMQEKQVPRYGRSQSTPRYGADGAMSSRSRAASARQSTERGMDEEKEKEEEERIQALAGILNETPQQRLERLAKYDVERRKNEEEKRKQEALQKAKETAKPRINPRSKQMTQNRTLNELVSGASTQRAREEAEEAREREFARQYTFRPTLSATSQMAASSEGVKKKRMLSSLSALDAHINEMNRQKQLLLEKERGERELKEMAECTFKPAIKESRRSLSATKKGPVYIRGLMHHLEMQDIARRIEAEKKEMLERISIHGSTISPARSSGSLSSTTSSDGRKSGASAGGEKRNGKKGGAAAARPFSASTASQQRTPQRRPQTALGLGNSSSSSSSQNTSSPSFTATSTFSPTIYSSPRSSLNLRGSSQQTSSSPLPASHLEAKQRRQEQMRMSGRSRSTELSRTGRSRSRSGSRTRGGGRKGEGYGAKGRRASARRRKNGGGRSRGRGSEDDGNDEDSSSGDSEYGLSDSYYDDSDSDDSIEELILRATMTPRERKLFDSKKRERELIASKDKWKSGDGTMKRKGDEQIKPTRPTIFSEIVDAPAKEKEKRQRLLNSTRAQQTAAASSAQQGRGGRGFRDGESSPSGLSYSPYAGGSSGADDEWGKEGRGGKKKQSVKRSRGRQLQTVDQKLLLSTLMDDESSDMLSSSSEEDVRWKERTIKRKEKLQREKERHAEFEKRLAEEERKAKEEEEERKRQEEREEKEMREKAMAAALREQEKQKEKEERRKAEAQRREEAALRNSRKYGYGAGVRGRARGKENSTPTGRRNLSASSLSPSLSPSMSTSRSLSASSSSYSPSPSPSIARTPPRPVSSRTTAVRA